MGLFDRDNLCGFDVNCDGKKDEIDDILFFEQMNKEEEKEESDWESEEFESYGIDKDMFDLMDDDEKREALEEAGLDPSDFGLDEEDEYDDEDEYGYQNAFFCWNQLPQSVIYKIYASGFDFEDNLTQ